MTVLINQPAQRAPLNARLDTVVPLGGLDDAARRRLLVHPGASDPAHPEHKAIRAKLDAHYRTTYGTQPIVD